MRRAVAAAGLLLLVLVAACSESGDGRRGAGEQVAPTAADTGEAVRFETATGAAVSGRLFGRAPGNGVVLVGSPGGPPLDWLARELVGVGVLVLTFDVPAGPPPAPGGTLPAVAATRAAGGYLRSRGAEKIALVGEREGATIALWAAAGDKVNGVAALSAPLEYRAGEAVLDAPAAASRIDRPVLIMGALGDTTAAAAARRLYEAARDPRTLALVPGHANGAEMVRGTEGAQALAVLRDFLREAFTPLSA